MIIEHSLRLLPIEAADENTIKIKLSQDCNLEKSSIKDIRIIRRSIDARHGNVFINLSLKAYVNETAPNELFTPIEYKDVSKNKSVCVVGAGPAGLFAALKIIELGYRPIVVERGKNVRERKLDIANIAKDQNINPESNYCFGEGGAGAYSDGKLYTRSKKRGSVEKILQVLVQHGADNSILYDVHPHIGTDKLPTVIENIRNTIINCGGEVRFSTKMIDFIIDNNEMKGVKTLNQETKEEKEIIAPVILATGHSARDIYHLCKEKQISIEPKGIAVGVRLEYPSKLIDQIQYHSTEGRGKYLPAAEYSFTTQCNERGVYSFCMCPGGVVIPAASDKEQIVVNGMSPSNRGTKWSNSGVVVEVKTEDVEGSDLLKMLTFQEQLEHDCWLQGNRKQTAPAQRMVDFVKNKLSFDLPNSSYQPGLISSPIHFWLPKFISSRLQECFLKLEKINKRFLTNEALIIGVETRTSAPVRILRDRETLQHINIKNFFPCGEGAGYAGGIVSAAIDGERCAEKCCEII